MTSAVFADFIENCAYPKHIFHKITIPIIFFVDGLETHVAIEVSELSRNLNIHFITPYPNASHIANCRRSIILSNKVWLDKNAS